MTNSRFDDWTDVHKCDKCQHYWNSTCDGKDIVLDKVEDGSQTRLQAFCRSFIPTRRETLEEEIKMAQKSLKWFWWALCILGLVFLVHVVNVGG